MFSLVTFRWRSPTSALLPGGVTGTQKREPVRQRSTSPPPPKRASGRDVLRVPPALGGRGLLLPGRDRRSQRGLATTSGPLSPHLSSSRTQRLSRRKTGSSALLAPGVHRAELSRRAALPAGRLWVSKSGAMDSSVAAGDSGLSPTGRTALLF